MHMRREGGAIWIIDRLEKLVCLFILVIAIASCGKQEIHSVKVNEVNEVNELKEGHKENSYVSAIQPIDDEVDTRPFLPEYMVKEALEGDYSQSIEGYETPNPSFDNLVGGIIPHHNLAYPFIGDFYREASKWNEKAPYDVIVLISPNHYSIGTRFQVSDEDYYTYDGVVETDHRLADALIKSKRIQKADKETVANEHGQLVHMPYIKAFMPETLVLSIIIGETRDDRGIQEVARILTQALVGKHVLYIGSIDFSHYLTLQEADRHDKVTESIIQDKQIEAMTGLSNDYIDSPSSYMLLLTVLDEVYGQELDVQIANHSNAAVIAKNRQMEETTSYFQVFYGIKE